MYRMIQQQKKNEMEALEEMKQLEIINQDLKDEEQTENKLNSMVGNDIANLIQGIDKKQD